MTKWGLYKPKGGLLPFRDDNGFDEWYYTERDIRGDLRLWVLVYKIKHRLYAYSVNCYGEYNSKYNRNGKTTTLRIAMIKATEACKNIVF